MWVAHLPTARASSLRLMSVAATSAGVVAVALMLTLAQPAQASVVYGSFAGTNMTFDDVAEDSGTDDLPLYGMSSVQTHITGGTAVDRLLFTPVDASFRASASGTAFVQDETDGQLSFQLTPHAGTTLSSLSIFEGGDWSVQPGSNGAVHVGGGITITGINGGTIIHTAGIDATLNPDGTWTGSSEIDLTPFNGMESIFVAIDNRLLAQVLEGNGTAVVAKKSFVVEVTSMPEPSTMLLLAGGALTVLCRRGRRGVAGEA